MGFQDRLSLYAGQKNCRILSWRYFRHALSFHPSLRPLFCVFLSGRLRQVLLCNKYNVNYNKSLPLKCYWSLFAKQYWSNLIWIHTVCPFTSISQIGLENLVCSRQLEQMAFSDDFFLISLLGYYGDGLNAIILFSGCYLPDRGRRDYQYVMDNLFL